MEFNVVIGNPPFDYYKKVVTKASTLSKRYYAFVTPMRWSGSVYWTTNKKSNTMLNLLMNDGMIIYHDIGNPFKSLGVQSIMNYFICDKSDTTESVIINGVPVDRCHGKIASPIEISIINKMQQCASTYPLKHGKGSLKRNEVDEYYSKHRDTKCIHSVGFTDKDFDWEWVDNNHKISGLGINKVVVSEMTSVGKLGALKFADASYACANGCYYFDVKDEEEAKKLIAHLTSDIIKFIVKILKRTTCHNSKTILDYIPMLHEPKLTKLERDYIENTIA